MKTYAYCSILYQRILARLDEQALTWIYPGIWKEDWKIPDTTVRFILVNIIRTLYSILNFIVKIQSSKNVEAKKNENILVAFSISHFISAQILAYNKFDLKYHGSGISTCKIELNPKRQSS